MAAPGKIEVLLVDDHQMVRQGLASGLAAKGDFHVAHCATSDEALVQLRSAEFDILLLDQNLGNERATDVLRKAREAGFKNRTVILTGHLTDLAARQLMKMDVAGILLKAEGIDTLAEKLREVYRGGTYFDLKVQDALKRLEQNGSTWRGEFTPREKITLIDVVNGLSNKEIASRYEVSESAVKATIQRLFFKTGARTRSQLVRAALENSCA